LTAGSASAGVAFSGRRIAMPGSDEGPRLKESVVREYERITGTLRARGLDLVFCESCGVVWNYDVREDCPLCRWSGVVR
jgi:hypothetical protein